MLPAVGVEMSRLQTLPCDTDICHDCAAHLDAPNSLVPFNIYKMNTTTALIRRAPVLVARSASSRFGGNGPQLRREIALY